jgi:spore coat polysaccharide biosynthesis protein SpsF
MLHDHQSANLHDPQSVISPIRTVAIIQARMGSSRLPGKVLREIAGEPMLARVVERTRRASRLDQVVIATTTEAGDDPVAQFCQARGYPCWRGSLHDVLDRYYQAARSYAAQVIVRITADCPLIDPDEIDHTVRAFLGEVTENDQLLADSNQQSAISSQQSAVSGQRSVGSSFPFDFAANRLPPPWGRTYPIGLDTEVCSFQALEIAWKEAQQPHQREHVMPFFYDHRERFRVLLVNYPVDYGKLRWTVDTADDLELVRQIYAHFPGRDDFSWLEVLALFHRHPDLAEINAQVPHKDYRQIDNRR